MAIAGLPRKPALAMRHLAPPYSPFFAILACGLVLTLPGCSKTNNINTQGQASTCSENAECDGACVEGECRPRCDAQFSCEGGATCNTVDEVPVCLPAGTRAYEPYEPFDLLRDCTGRDGCEAALDAPELRGRLVECTYFQGTTADVQDPDFDYAAACAETFDDSSYYVNGRSQFRIDDGECSEQSVLGTGAEGTLVTTCRYESAPDRAEFARLVVKEEGTYVWSGGAIPMTWPGADDNPNEDWLYTLSKYEPGPVPDADDGPCVTPNDSCSLPKFPRIGAPATTLAGMWVQCDGSTPDTCDETWDGPALNEWRRVVYITEDGFGQVMSKGGDAYEPRPMTCNAAFRMGANNQTVVLQHANLPVGDLLVDAYPWIALPLEQGDFLVQSTETGSQQTIFGDFYKKVPPPADFEDPCANDTPRFEF